MTSATPPLALAAALLPLAACGSEPEQQAAAPEPVAAATPATAQTGAAPLDPDIAKGEIPARFHGVWDAVSGTCDPASDLRVEIAARRIGFYESAGDVAGVGSEGSDAIADLVMEGEGESWVQTTRLSIETTPEGERLHLSDAAEPKVPDDNPRKRCPA
ncbi:hypothetical protein [Erythrobacter sp. CCH5-A1]|jgi:hypothetical protein|uniref:hypothetical protein n=1 Tax=Erythrobacter sp. CCH5-A1 TaxID=1768792 RepID=UPI00083396E4|nr:hypothetical protein [Erythrobacter sp. CCH5-A1]